MRVILALVAILFLTAIGITLFVWSGTYNVAATEPHWSPTTWLMEKVRERSISVHSQGIAPPPSKDWSISNAGFRHYHTMCRLCHNAPGYPRTEISRGLYPAPPDFTAKGAKLPDDAETFWIVKNGIKMTGMPAFGSTHTEEELWATVFLAKSIPVMKQEEYGTMEKAVGLQKGTGHHH